MKAHLRLQLHIGPSMTMKMQVEIFQLSYDVQPSVRPKLGFGIGNRNQDQVLVSVFGPELFLPKPKLSSSFSSLILFPKK